MLISRRVGESVQLEIDGEPFTITVVGVRDGAVKLGFTGQRTVRVLRSELLTRAAARAREKGGQS